MDYSEKVKLYNQNFSIGYFESDNVNDKLILLSLVSLVYLKTKEKNSKVKPIDILLQISKTKDKDYIEMLESLSIMVEELCFGAKIADPCGLKTSKEIINKIKEILNTWTPF